MENEIDPTQMKEIWPLIRPNRRRREGILNYL